MRNSNQMSYASLIAKLEDGTVSLSIDTNNHRFIEKDLHDILANVMGVDVSEWRHLVDRGMRPVKAAIRLGAEPNIAQLVGDLKLAITAEDINRVYADDRCLSCMLGKPVGDFWVMNRVGCIYAPNFRVLIGLDTWGLNPRAYGYKGAKVYQILKRYLEGSTLIRTTRVAETKKVLIPVGKRTVLRQSLIAIDIKTEDTPEIRAFLKASISHHGGYGSQLWTTDTGRIISPTRASVNKILLDGSWVVETENAWVSPLFKVLEEREPVIGDQYIKTPNGGLGYVITSEEDSDVCVTLERSVEKTVLDIKTTDKVFIPYLDFDTYYLIESSDNMVGDALIPTEQEIQEAFNSQSEDDISF